MMKKIIPFKKDIIFKTNIAEVTSISLEHTLQIEEDSLITGEFIISGEYKISDTSTNTEVFHFNLPFDIHMDEHYDLSECKVDIYDFYYEIVNDKVLLVNIEVSVNHLKEKPLLEEVKREVTDILEDTKEELVKEEEQEVVEEPVREEKKEIVEEVKEEKDEKEEEKKEVKVEEKQILKRSDDKKIEEVREKSIPVSSTSSSVTEKITSIFPDTMTTSDTYATYKVYIVRESDTIEMVLQKYGVTKEVLEQYNDLTEVKIGDKLIIPEYYVKN